MKHRILFILLFAASAFTCAQASAESIAVVNYQLIFHDSSAGKSVGDQLDAKQRAFHTEMSRKEDELNKEQDSLAQQRAVLSPEAFDKKAKAFRAKANAAQRDVQAKRIELENASVTAGNDIQKAMFSIVSKIAKERGYTLVIPSSPLTYADPKLDITNDVLTQLNATLPKVNVSFKAPPSGTSNE